MSFVSSVTRLNEFLYFLAKNVLTKVAQKFCDCRGDFEKTSLFSKSCCGYFLGTFLKILAAKHSSIWSHWLWWALKNSFVVISLLFLHATMRLRPSSSIWKAHSWESNPFDDALLPRYFYHFHFFFNPSRVASTSSSSSSLECEKETFLLASFNSR